MLSGSAIAALQAALYKFDIFIRLFYENLIKIRLMEGERSTYVLANINLKKK